jgi:23S rRNA (uracil1939-C5)-methyltransferase
LLQTLIDEAVGGESGETAIDFYSGAALFSIPLARRFKSVVAVESDADAVAFARKNKDVGRVENLRIFEGRIREFLKDHGGDRADVVVVDPPRSGVKEKILKKIAGMCNERLIYISCNPSTLARDLGVILKLGFAIESVAAVDLFPQTHHVETIVRMSRSGPRDI